VHKSSIDKVRLIDAVLIIIFLCLNLSLCILYTEKNQTKKGVFMREGKIRDLLRAAAAYYDLPLHNGGGKDHGYGLWLIGEGFGAYRDEIKNNYQIDQFFIRANNVAKYILNFPEGPIKRKLLKSAFHSEDLHARSEPSDSDSTRAEINDDGGGPAGSAESANKLPLNLIFELARQKLSGLGNLRLLINPPGYGVKYHVGALAGLFSGAIANPTRALRYYMSLLKQAYSAIGTAAEPEPELNKLSTQQRWVFEPGGDLGRSITAFMMELLIMPNPNKHCGTDGTIAYEKIIKFQEKLNDIITKLFSSENNTSTAQEKKELLTMSLRDKGEFEDLSLLACIACRPGCLDHFLKSMPATFECKQDVRVELCKHVPALEEDARVIELARGEATAFGKSGGMELTAGPHDKRNEGVPPKVNGL
jgi:hypothetical protein